MQDSNVNKYRRSQKGNGEYSTRSVEANSEKKKIQRLGNGSEPQLGASLYLGS